MQEGSPEPSRIAIIGAGWSGLQCAQCLKEKGIQFDIFDKNTEIGGTWAPEMSYDQLTLHSARWLNQMTKNGDLIPFPKGEKGYMDQKADAAEVLQYLKDFVKQCGLQPNIHSETLVKEVHYDSKSRLAHLVVAKESVEKREGPYNLVIFASLSGSAKMPDIPNRGFTGKLMHSCELKAKTMSEIVDAKSSVLVIGAGKSGCDMIQAFQKAGYENVMWLYRQPYWFFSFETFFHDRSLLSMLRAFLALVFVTLSLASPSLCMFALWAIGYAIMPGCSGWPKHFNAVRFHFGMLCERQLSFIKKVKPVTGDPDHFQKGGVVLKSGEAMDCDVIICATGYNTGLDTIQCIKDGKPISVTGCPLYEHAIVPRFPCLISAATAFYHFGPIRGVSLAEYVAHVLKNPISEETMEAVANKNLCKQTSTTFLGYSSSMIFTSQWLLLYVDMWRTGLLSIGSFLELGITTFVTAQYRPLRLNVSS